MMKTAQAGRMLSLATAGLFACFQAQTAVAEIISKRAAQSRIESIEKYDSEFLAKFPALNGLIDVVKSDCAAKVPERAASSTFCVCAAAVTMELWRSGADPKMLPRLAEFATAPDSSHAAEFLKYQGPELYRPLCEIAEP